ncbi:hypothetical protein T492DRAFT_593305 [Pavlovales sp. CCMP2436]|nr:hypothetical protein T492DRAFT_593305 [Pavlovales sp. CCMP2436]
MVAVGCGIPPTGSGIVIKIVEPETRVCLHPPARGVATHGHPLVGEVWIASESVANGYWAGVDGKGPLAQLSEETFSALIAGEEAGGTKYLRTGDLGFVQGGELFICGRQKDLLIVRGRNHYPQDLERAAEKAAPELRPGCCAVFAVPADQVRTKFKYLGVRPSPDRSPSDPSVMKTLGLRDLCRAHGYHPHH